MDEKEWKTFDEQALKLIMHKKKCDYDEPGIQSIIAAHAELIQRREDEEWLMENEALVTFDDWKVRIMGTGRGDHHVAPTLHEAIREARKG